jgi:sugar/nucleoside kinase (ribokinase family)
MTGTIHALVVGAISRDLDAGEPSAAARPGGVVHHAGAALARLGAQARVLTRVRPEDAATLLAPLRAEGVEVRALPSRRTTTYRNDYSRGADVHELLAASDRIGPDDVPRAWRSSDLIQLGPLHRADVDPALPSALSGRIGIDIQGLVRQPGAAGASPPPYPHLDQLLEQVEVVQASEAELGRLLLGDTLEQFVRHTLEQFVRRHEIEEMIVTRGARGATLLTGARRMEIPARTVEGRSRVGAGDVFLAAYLLFRSLGFGPCDAGRRAAGVSAAKIEAGEVPRELRPGGIAP